MKQPSIFLPHGGGPCFFMDPPPNDPLLWVPMANYLRNLPHMLRQKPSALLIISGHWEKPTPTILADENPALLYDYYNFPPHTYRLTYPAPGAPALGARVRALLADANIESGEETGRGYDHGIFIPMKVSFPDADIPILQLSLRQDLDPAFHIEVGRALAPLREENILIIGSGLSFHDLRSLGNPAMNQPAAAFDNWLTETLCGVPPDQREARLTQWASAPYARACHPREEHLLPLMVATGAALSDPGTHAFSGTIWGKAVSAYHFT